ncbi:MAG: ABC transporter substrate-binding protein [Candidatus Woesearchaeota archaeon]|jgi:branched-chain amino acid transport system substrate-binding protein|nr:ABC transporter substrate-binding protein [Candidatus Woesearchaeota archaeon]MDP7180914.1 ABC transporter substrate-binding protein [Candidatus Woesearchaeota archaeon]MDP7199149.1 ABC transporter substrate-binding protein [Candidatus Woesearchaeota archaeon]MDP7467588.1 ABC transporter substrate-binding protein [Candidatus Woesearchaeota archaeon]MDP7647070.1 ABC transporter substrate-binding protein [Candidatus Woesearchaeota archaeon]|tara:strand:+ start:370 stop:1437 length:1068 start_codon:yes stop_codon:yes gene_type:complete
MKYYALLLLILAGCGSDAIVVGVLGTLTGVGSFQGEEERRGLEIALEELTEQGMDIRLVYEDTRAEPATAVTAAKKLMEVDGARYIIGDSWSSTTVAVVPFTNENNVLLISPIVLLDSLSQDDLFFRTMSTTDRMMELLAQHAYAQGARRVAVLHQQTPFGVEHVEDFKKYFESMGGTMVATETFTMTATDVRSEITKVLQKNPDTILNLHSSGPMQGLLIKQAKELGADVLWLSHFGAESQPMLEAYGNIVEGIVYPYPYDVNSEAANVQAFVQKYQSKYGGVPSLGAANAYDSLHLLVLGFQYSREPEEIKQFLLGVQNYAGAGGSLSFDKNGDVKKPVLIKTVKNGKFVKFT